MAKRNEGEVTPVAILWTYSEKEKGLHPNPIHPVKVCLTHQRRRAYYSVMGPDKTKLFLTKEYYDEIMQVEPRKLKGEKKRDRKIIDAAVSHARNKVSEATNQGRDPFSFGEFERKYLGQEAGSHFLKFFKAHVDSIQSRQAGTARVYESVLRSFGKFINNGNPIIEEKGRNNWVYKENHRDIDPAEITPELLQKYEESLRGNGDSDTWISICTRSIRAIYNRIAAKDDFLKMKYPFSRNDYDEGYKIPVSSGQKGVTLTKVELSDFIRGKIPGEVAPENPYYMAKMLFMFSFYGQGINFKDMALLRYSNLQGNTIVFERQKTIRRKKKAVEVRIPVTKELNNILVEISNPDKRKSAFIFSVFDHLKTYTAKEIDRNVMQWVKTTNKWLRRYCQHNKIPVVTTYATRHSFASISKSFLPVAQISKMLGHTKIETTQTYLGRFEDDENRSGLMKVFRSIKKKSA